MTKGRVPSTATRRVVRRVSYGLEDGVWILAFAEARDGRGRSLVFQRAVRVGAQDRELGMDTVCLTRDDGPSVYGGLEACCVEATRVTLRLQAAAATTLGLKATVWLDLEVPATEIAAAVRGLRRCLRGKVPVVRVGRA